jgi:hypothetical protein
MAEAHPLADYAFPDRIPLKDGAETLYFVNAEGARRLAKKGLARIMVVNGKVRALEAIRIHRATPGPVLGLGGSDPLHSPAYSHNHEVSETYLDDDGEIRHRHPLDANPENVWTLRRLPDETRDIYRTVVTECIRFDMPARVIEFKQRPRVRLPKAA